MLRSGFFYGSLIAVIVIFFTGIDRIFPDAAIDVQMDSWRERRELSSIRWSLAWLFVSFPLFLWLSRFLHKEMIAKPERAWSGIRRGLTYLTLLAAALAIAIDLVTLIFNVLEGELTTRFMIKVLVIFGVAGLTFAFDMVSLRQPIAAPATIRTRRAFLAAALMTVGVAVVWGCTMAGSPITERQRRIDESRISDLERIQDALEEYCLDSTRSGWIDKKEMKRPLPPSLATMLPELKRYQPTLEDPESGDPYLYEITGASSYRIGAHFDSERQDQMNPIWNHAAGLVWFEFDLLND